MPSLGNTLTTYIGNNPTPVVTTRNAGESDQDFIRRHGRAVLAVLQGSGANMLICAELGLELEREPDQSDEAFAAAYVELLEAVA